MNNLNIIIVEGNIPEDNEVFVRCAGASASNNIKNLILKLEPSTNIKIINPRKDEETSQALENMENFNGVIFTGGAMRLNDMTDDIKKHINFASNCISFQKKILAICWGLQVCSVVAGGKVSVAKNGPHIGIASDVKINEEGKKNLIYRNKKTIFTTPAFNFDEVCEIPKGAVLLSSDKINKVMGIYFEHKNSKIWGLQYHPDYEYHQMINLSNARREKIMNNNYFASDDEFNNHLSFMKDEEKKLNFDDRTCEIKNWLEIIKTN